MSHQTTAPILTLTLNPALDLTGHLEQMQVGEVNLVRSGHLHPAGKGINVARVLKDLGAEVLVSGFLGQENQAPFHELFHDAGLGDHFLVVPGATRINVKMVEASGRVTDLNFPGVEVFDDEVLVRSRRAYFIGDIVFAVSGKRVESVSSGLGDFGYLVDPFTIFVFGICAHALRNGEIVGHQIPHADGIQVGTYTTVIEVIRA